MRVVPGALRSVVRMVFVSALLMLFCDAVHAQLTVSNALQSGMVIQQNKPFKIWGRSIPATQVTVLSDWTAPVSVVTASDSTYLVILPVPAVRAGDFNSHKLTIQSGSSGIDLNDLLIGDVWFCSGQSNMQFSLKEDTNAAREVPAANYPNIRLLKADLNFSASPVDVFKGKWETCTPATAKEFSAVGYSFGRDLYNRLQIPIGLVWSGIGASAAQAFVPQEVMAADTMLNRVYLQPYLTSEKSKEKIDGGFSFEKVTRPFLLYNAMIYPFRNLSIKGFCWYQGESNRNERQSYTRLTQAMIEAWRDKFGQGSLPFYLVQVAPYHWDSFDPELADYSFFREAQQKITELNNTGMAFTTDVGDAKDLHPKNKIPIGHRLALLALNQTYGQLDVVASGPRYEFIEFAGSKAIVHYRKEGSAGLKTNDGKAPVFFTVAGKDQQFHSATATIVGNTIQLVSGKVKKPVAVRYAFTNFAVTNLENVEGLPAVPFRSDSFDETPVVK